MNDCGICYETREKEFFLFLDCCHQMCHQCFIKLKQSTSRFLCPFCRHTISNEIVEIAPTLIGLSVPAYDSYPRITTDDIIEMDRRMVDATRRRRGRHRRKKKNKNIPRTKRSDSDKIKQLYRNRRSSGWRGRF